MCSKILAWPAYQISATNYFMPVEHNITLQSVCNGISQNNCMTCIYGGHWAANQTCGTHWLSRMSQNWRKTSILSNTSIWWLLPWGGGKDSGTAWFALDNLADPNLADPLIAIHNYKAKKHLVKIVFCTCAKHLYN